MALWVARWVDFTCTLLRAETREEAIDVLDEIGGDEGIELFEYDGPVCIHFALPMPQLDPIRPAARKLDRKLTRDDIDIGDLGGLVSGRPLVATPADCGDGILMQRALLQATFPHLAKAVVGRDQEEDPPDEAEVRAALVREADVALRANWRLHALATSQDPVARQARQMGASLEWVRNQMGRKQDD